MSAITEFESLKKQVLEAEDDVRKADGGNKAAGTRVRKKMQEIKQAAQGVRVKILESRGGDDDAAGGGAGGTTGGGEATGSGNA